MRIAGLGFLSVLVLILYRNVIGDMIQVWNDDLNYSHGFLIPFIAAYFIWNMKDRMGETRPAWAGLVILAAGLCLFYTGVISAEFFTMRVSLLVVISGLVLFNLGTAYFRLLFFPILFLMLMIPLPAIVFNMIAFPLQLLAAQSAAFSLQLCDIPVLRDGNIIQLAGTTLEVAEACSGIRSLISLLTLGIVYAYMMHPEVWKRVVLGLSAIPIAILANAARVSGTGILAHFWGEEVAQGFYHTFAGFLVFAVALAILFFEDIIVFKLIPRFLK